MLRRFKFVQACASVVAVVMVAMVGMTATASATEEAAAVYRIFNYNSGKCLSIPGSATAPGVQATQFECDPSSSAKQFIIWVRDTPDAYGNPVVRLENANSHLFLAVANASTVEGTAVVQWYDRPTNAEQQWAWDKAGRLRNLATNQCLAVPHGWLSDGVKLIQWGCSTGLEQQWGQLSA